MASEWEAIVEWFDEKAKARTAEANAATSLSEACVTSIRVNGGGSYRPAPVVWGGNDRPSPIKSRLLRGRPYSFQNTIECHKRLTRIASKGQTQLSPPIPQTAPRKKLRKFQLDGLSDRWYREAWNRALKRLGSKKLAERLALDLLDSDSDSD